MSVNKKNYKVLDSDSDGETQKTAEVDENEECVICFEELDKKKSFIGCETCGKSCHVKCYCDWFDKNIGNPRVCIVCQQPTLTMVENKISTFTRCLHFFWEEHPNPKQSLHTLEACKKI